jgi:hypothetical protein
VTGILLDTNVVSEITRGSPDLSVLGFLDQQPDVWIASLVVYELEFGLHRAPRGRRRERLRDDLADLLRRYENRILPLDREGAEWAARFRAEAFRAGRPPSLADMLIAGTARAHDLAIATRNVRDFEGLDVEVVNPWEPLPPTTSR